MADLSRAVGRFAKSTVSGWNGTAWVDTGLRGRLQVYDRFITERDFGQRKRILTLAGDVSLPSQYKVVRVGGSTTTYLVESALEDIDENTTYCTTFALHEAPFQVQICKNTTTESKSGVKRNTALAVLATTWVDISRYSATDSKAFPLTDYTIYNVYFPPGTTLDTDTIVKRVDNGEVLDITELYQVLDIPAARCQRRG